MRRPWHIPTYVSKLTTNQASIIFQARTRMSKLKQLQKGQNDLLCRLCKTKQKQQYILEECQGLQLDDSTKVTKVEDLFDEEIPKLTEIANRTELTINKLEQIQTSAHDVR